LELSWSIDIDTGIETGKAACSWLNPQFCGNDEAGPVSAIYFVHMRKSGGSSVAAMIKNWMIDQGCVNSTWAKGHAHMINVGWIHGRPVPRKFTAADEVPSVSTTCPHFALIHNEIACVNGIELLESTTSRALPPLSKVTAVPLTGTARPPKLTYFTTLRDPIERVGSQAFYQNGVGTRTINEIGQKICKGVVNGVGLCKQNPKDKSCRCVERAKALAIARLKVEPQLWFKWFNSTDLRVWQWDFYARNYYIRRLMGITIGERERRKDVAGTCLRDPSMCGQISPAKLGYNTLATLGHQMHCQTGRTEPLETVDWDAALQRVKDVLRDHFELVITERMSGDASQAVLQRVFGPDFLRAQTQASIMRANSQSLISFKAFESKSGQTNAAESRSYTSFMPESVVAYLRKENAADIELYRYAVELFEARAAATSINATR